MPRSFALTFAAVMLRLMLGVAGALHLDFRASYQAVAWLSWLPNLILAWAYVVLRVIHSVVQATVNVVLVRFAIFIASSLVLAALAGRDVWALFNG